MFSKTILSTLAVVILTTSSFSSTARASDEGQEVAPVTKNDSGKIAAGTVIGLAAAIIGAKLFESDNRNNGQRKHKRDQVVEADFGDEDCFEKPVRKYSAKHGKKIVVGFKIVCE
ncbi:hypothetical protein [Pararhizobium sp.]|uniref:hypothetical protein n=1 Tax=Pararhizobium sp. TaxID=1977563 RepID=UPI0027260895|nr:hypothetical protein [Pararhizobium sp.]MDO9416459.1 hypothetical protein [Pararhizobium sp.]